MRYAWLIGTLALIALGFVLLAHAAHATKSRAYTMRIYQGQVVLTWSDPNASSTQVTGYNVYRTTISGGYYGQVNSGLVPAGTLTYTDTTVQVGHTYYYVVTAVNALGESGFSPQVTAPMP